MFCKKATLFFSYSSILLATTAYASANNSSSTSVETKPGIEVNIQGDTHQTYQSDVKTSGQQNIGDTIMGDKRIQSEIQSMIENKFRKYNINITVYNGNVILKGYVENAQAKKNIEQEIHKIQGVKNINNMLTIK